MIRNIVIIVLLLIIGALIDIMDCQRDIINKAKAYINALENDFPEYIDTTSGTDAYSEWYKLNLK